MLLRPYRKNLISIIVPVYKVECYLKRCVDSILMQTYKNFELILVDDGSPDNAPWICDEYARRDCRVRVIHKLNGGLSSARNAGLDAAKGEYIGFVDSDDFIKPQMYEKLLHALQESRADLAVCGYYYVDENGDECDVSPCIPNKDILVQGKEAYHILSERLMVPAWNKLYRYEIFASLRYPVGRLHEDEFIKASLYHNRSVICICEPLLYYTQRPDSIMSKLTMKRLQDSSDALREQVEFYIRHGYPSEITVQTIQAIFWLCLGKSWKQLKKDPAFRVFYRRTLRETRDLVRRCGLKGLSAYTCLVLLFEALNPHFAYSIAERLGRT